MAEQELEERDGQVGQGLDLVRCGQFREDGVQQGGDGLQVQEAGLSSGENGTQPGVQEHQREQGLRCGDYSNIFQDTQTVLDKEIQELLVVVEV